MLFDGFLIYLHFVRSFKICGEAAQFAISSRKILPHVPQSAHFSMEDEQAEFESLPDLRGHIISINRSQAGTAALFKIFLTTQNGPTVTNKWVRYCMI
jgi:hypothetical protein